MEPLQLGPPPRRVTFSKKLYLLFLVSCAIAYAAFEFSVAPGYEEARKIERLIDHGVRATATVIDTGRMRYDCDAVKSCYRRTVRFEYVDQRGVRRTAMAQVQRGTHAVGDTLSIRYDAQHPSRVVVPDLMEFNGAHWGAMVVGAIPPTMLLVPSVLLLGFALRRKWIYRSAPAYAATYVGGFYSTTEVEVVGDDGHVVKLLARGRIAATPGDRVIVLGHALRSRQLWVYDPSGFVKIQLAGPGNVRLPPATIVES